MNHFRKVLFALLGLCRAEQSDLPTSNTPLSEMVRGAFINNWPLLNRPDLQHLRSGSVKAANFQDTDDCAKKLLCELSRKKDRSWDEDLVYTYYDQPVDYTSDSLFFNIAVQVGKDGERDCQDAYPSCFLKLPEMLKIIRRQGISFELPADELECQVYVVWRKKDRNDESSKVKQKSLKSQKPATIELFKAKSKIVLTNEDAGFAEDIVAVKVKSIETARTKSDTLLWQESEHEHRLADYNIKSNSTDQQKKMNGKKEFMNLGPVKSIINKTEPDHLHIDTKLTLYMDEFENETSEANLNNETEEKEFLNLRSEKSIINKTKTNKNQNKSVEIGGVTDEEPEISETQSKNIQINDQTASGIMNILVGFARRKSNELQKSDLEKESRARGDKDEVTNDTNMFREGALGGVIGGVIGGLLGVYRSFV